MAGCGIRDMLKAGCGIRDMLKARCGMKKEGETGI